MNLIINISWKHRPAVMVAVGVVVAMMLFLTSSFDVTYAAEPSTHAGSHKADVIVLAPITTPVPPEVITDVVVVTETIPVTETVVVTDTVIVTNTVVVTERVELTGTVQGTVLLPTTIIVSSTEVITGTELVTSTIVVTATETIFLDVGVLEGQIWHDLDNNATSIISVGDQSLSGVIIRLSSANGIFLETTTDANGMYRFGNLPLNRSYSVQVDPLSLPDNKKFRPNYDPDSVLNSVTLITLTGDDPVAGGLNFSYAAGDYGDLPDSYSTGAPNGAFHATVIDGSQITLGAGLDVEVIASIDTNARGDGQDNGIARLGSFVAGGKTAFSVFVDGATGPTGATLGVWADWNLDGMFSEDEFESFAVIGEETVIQLSVPEDYTDSPIPVRFRLFDSEQIPGGTIDWTDFQGPAINGEVEDYIYALSTAVSLSQVELTTTPARFLVISLIALTAVTATLGVNRVGSEQ